MDPWEKRGHGADRQRLLREADVLASRAHPGLVELLEVVEEADATVLRTSRVDGPVLQDLTLTPIEIAGVAAALSTTLADLHAAGVAHGRVTPDHVLLEGGERPRLCGLAEATTAPGGPAADVLAIGVLVERLLAGSHAAPGGGGRPALAVARVAASATCVDPARRPSAAALAAQLAAIPGACLPGQAAVVPTPARRGLDRRGKGMVVAGMVVAGMVAAIVVLAAVSRADGAHRPEQEGRAAVVEHAGERFEVGLPGDLVVVADWDGDGTATPVVVRPRTGAVFRFDTWPTGRRAVARPMAWVAGATRAVAVRRNGRVDLVVHRAAGRPAVTVRRAAP